MPIEIIVAVISASSAIVGSVIGVLSGQSLLKYRLEKVEIEAGAIQNLADRILTLEITVNEMRKDLLKVESEIKDE